MGGELTSAIESTLQIKEVKLVGIEYTAPRRFELAGCLYVFIIVQVVELFKSKIQIDELLCKCTKDKSSSC